MNDIEKLSPDIKKLAALHVKQESEREARQRVNERRARIQGIPVSQLRQLDPLVPVNTLPNNGDGQDGLLPKEQLEVGLIVTFVPWADMTEKDYKIFYAFDGEDFEKPNHILVLPDFQPFDHTFDLSRFELAHGPHTLVWMTEGQESGNTQDGPPLNFFVDIHHPDMLEQPDPIVLPADLPDGDITLDYLEQNGGVLLTIPAFSDPRPDDTFDFYIDGVAVLVDQPAPSPAAFTVPAAEFEKLEEGMIRLTYTLTDRAGNRSQDSLPTPVRLVLSPAPVVDPPEIPEGPAISLADARDGVMVFQDYAIPMEGDFVSVYWQGIEQDSFFWPNTSVTVPFADIKQPGEAYTASVHYIVNRKGKLYQSGPTLVDVDLETTGPDPDPENPDIINPNLVPLTLTSFTGEINQIVPADKGQNASIVVQLYLNAAVGEMIEVFYGNLGNSLGARALDQNDLTQGSITVDVPWPTIQAVGNGTIDSFYHVYPANKPENAQQAPITPILVTVNNLEDLPLAVFPDRNPDLNIINCNNEPWENGVNVRMDYPTFEADDEVTLNWVLDNTIVPPDETVVPTDPLEPTRRDYNHRVTAIEASLGTITINVPWGTHMSDLTEGCIVVEWHLKRGDVNGSSAKQFVRYSRHRPSGGRPVCPDEDPVEP